MEVRLGDVRNHKFEWRILALQGKLVQNKCGTLEI